MSLVGTYLAQAERRGDTISEALAELNTDLRASYSLSRLGEWRNGRRPIPPAVSAAAGNRGGNPGPPRHAAAVLSLDNRQLEYVRFDQPVDPDMPVRLSHG